MDKNIPDDKPPVFKTWKHFYWMVFINLIILLTLFYAFTRMFE